jgi:hypothetical protein
VDQYVTAQKCKERESAVRHRIKWLVGLIILLLGITGLTAEEAWRARDGFDTIHHKLERQTGVSETQFKGIQRSLDRIDRKLETQEAALHAILRAAPAHDESP